MKKYLIITNCVVFMLVGLMVWLHFNNHMGRVLTYDSTPEKANHAPVSPWKGLDSPSLPRSLSLIEGDLFDPKRGQREVVAPPPKVVPMPESVKKNIELTGILRVNNRSVAFIDNRNPKAGGHSLYRVGDQLEGFTVSDITSDAVLLEKGAIKEWIGINRFDQHSTDRMNGAGVGQPYRRSATPKSNIERLLERQKAIEAKRKELFMNNLKKR